MSLYAVFVHSSGNFLSGLYSVWNQDLKVKTVTKIWHLLYAEISYSPLKYLIIVLALAWMFLDISIPHFLENRYTLENFLRLYGSVLHAHSLTCLHIHLRFVSQKWNEMVISQKFCYRSYELRRYVYLKFAAELILVWGGFMCVIFFSLAWRCCYFTCEFMVLFTMLHWYVEGIK